MNIEENLKDSCGYAVDVAKQFITFSVTAIGFVVTLFLFENYLSFTPTIILLSLLGLGMLFGICFILSVIAHINQTKNYNVYSPMLRNLIITQIVLFLLAILGICVVIFAIPKRSSHDKSYDIKVSIGNKTLQYNILPNSKVNLTIEENGKIELQNSL